MVREGMENGMHGKHHTEEAKQKMSESHKGKSHTEEYKRNIGKAHLGKKRKFFTEETKANMSKAHLGIIFTEEHKQNLCNHKGFTGKHHTEETKQQIRESTLAEKNHCWNGGRAAKEERRRGFGFVPLNEQFLGAVGHHLDNELVLYIPKELHMSVYHNQRTGRGMEEINNFVCEYVYGIKTGQI